MGFKSLIIKPIAKIAARKIQKESLQAVAIQEKWMHRLIQSAKNTAFGKDHHFELISDYNSFKKQIPLNDYEGISPYIQRIIAGEKNVLWKGKPIYFAKTSGTTSGIKYIPITKESVSNHVGSARDAVFMYILETGNASFFDGGMIFLSGSPILDKINGILTGRLSGIVNHQIPFYVKKNQLPSWNTNCIDDWEVKVKKIAEETHQKDMRLIGGIPPWVQMYFQELKYISNKKNIVDLFPNLQLYVYGGTNYEPYRKSIEAEIGKKVDTIETYPASEGFIAFQDSQKEKGLLLLTNTGIFYEFVPANEIHSTNPTRLSLEEVEMGVNYAIILNTNAGLWGYIIGDTVRFVSKNPYRLVVTGRTKHFISAFGEHVIGEEVEQALHEALQRTDAEVTEFHLAPKVNPAPGELPHHEWFIEFSKTPSNMEEFRKIINEALCKKNTYYNDLIEGKILQILQVTPLQKNAFITFMKNKGKLGGQNKVPRLADNREIADELEKYKI